MTRRGSLVRVDLHCHSDRSDGYYPPDVVATLLARGGVGFAALTDHQTASGTASFQEEAKRRGFAGITGAEISARLGELEIHLLAYGFDPADTIMQRLFSRTVSAAETIAAVHEARGVVVLAHPLHTVPDRPDLESVVGKLVDRGLDGLEVFYSSYSEEDQQFLLDLADRHSLLTTGGSDFHGPGTVGAPEPGVNMPEERWKHFRRALGNSHAGENASGERLSGEEAARHPPQARIDWRWLFPRIVLPSLLVIGFFVTLLFAVLIPTVEEMLLERKRETTAELTNSAWSILADYDRQVREGLISLEQAQAAAIERIRRLRYGPEELDYFWITDMHPRMVMHPYRPDLEGSDLTGFTDPDGVRPFVEFVQAVRDRSSGYVRYVWQWQDDPERLEAKDSYVRGFEPWGWIIGTGLYEDDVKREIGLITSRMIDASFIVTILAGALLLLITHQSLKLERRRSEAERDLQLSHERYRLLVESSTAGTLLLVEGHCSYANRPMLEMLGYSLAELALLDLSDIITPEEGDPEGSAGKLRRIAAGEEIREPFEAQLIPRDAPPEPVLVSSTTVFLSGRNAVILNVQDLSHHQAVRTALGESRAKYEVLARNISSGVFRMVLHGEMPIIEMNPAAERIFGLQEGFQQPLSFRDLLATEESRRQFLQRLQADGTVRDMIVQVRGGTGKLRTVRLSAVLAESESESHPLCDAIMEDISERRRTEAQRETLISQLQTSLLFLTEQVRNSMNEAVSCSMDTPVTRVVRLMGRHGTEAIVVTGGGGEPVGIVTDHDIRERVVAAELDTRMPVSRIMSAPVVTISETAPIFEAFLLERNHEVDHLVVTDSAGILTGIIRSSRTVRLDEYSPVVLLKLIANAPSVDDLADCHDKLPVLVGSLVDSGAASENICHVTTAVSDAIAQRVIVLAVEELGPPPAPFAFVALGSEAREEQTLVTDQDNAIIFQPEGTEADADCGAYFLRLGELVCRGLEQAGYPLCAGEAMAQDPRWNRTLEDWKKSFTTWIAEPDGTALAHCNVFFDLRCIYGDRALVRDLWQHVDRQLEKNPAFFSHMALNTLQYKPPLGLFGQIVTTSSGEGANTFDIKGAMLPIVNFARLYALRNHLSETNTFDRLEQLHALGVLQEESFRGTLQAYDHLMRLRYRHQVKMVREGKEPNNLIDPRALTQIESGTVKNTLSRISVIQKKVSYDFKGSA